jgi:uncharacterized protein YegP (UPF0339 family)
MNKPYKVEILQAKNNEYCWHIKAGNGQIVATSGETFTTKQSCKESFLRVANAFNMANVDTANL